MEAAVMSTTLNFYDATWASARVAVTAGKRADALAFLSPLLNADDAPPRLVLLAHRLAGRLHYAAERYAKARRHLRTAAKLDPTVAEVHYELGLAFENDPYGCDRRAARRFLHAVKLDSSQPRFTAAAGRALVRINRVRAGVAHLLAAAKQAPADPAVLAVVVDGLCDAGRLKEAESVVSKARFLLPREPKIDRLREEVRYADARRAQGSSRVGVGGPTVLPFLSATGSTRVVRRDLGSRPAPHFGTLRAYR
jgi:Flp pilus assembly protein TadD